MHEPEDHWVHCRVQKTRQKPSWTSTQGHLGQKIWSAKQFRINGTRLPTGAASTRAPEAVVLLDATADVLVRVAVRSIEGIVTINWSRAQATRRILRRRVEGDAVIRRCVPVLVDIKLAQVTARLGEAVHPKGRPRAARGLREVCEVGHKQAILIR